MLVIICYLKLIIIIWERLHQVGSVHLPVFQSLHKIGHHTCLHQLIKCEGFWEYKRDFRWPLKKKSQVLKISGDFGAMACPQNMTLISLPGKVGTYVLYANMQCSPVHCFTATEITSNSKDNRRSHTSLLALQA